ncbi:DUF2272 domain-containing protein [Nocardia fluminea]|uniref:DUF2272 domain-containing protein n=1 Tax=Nocardia fluminea TaxID=134984 RepID=UPI003661B3F0
MTGPNLWCGFFGPGETRVRDKDLRDAIVQTAESERLKWFNAAQNSALREGAGTQFQHLIRYALARHSSIRPTTLTAAQTQAAVPNYGPLLMNPTPARIVRVREDLLAGAPHVGTPSTPSNLEVLVESNIRSALDFKNDINTQTTQSAWSAVFVLFCVRAAAIQTGLEADFDDQHVGRDGLLFGDGSTGHRTYIVEAYNRLRGSTKATYHAFPATERAVQLGDIIVLDRQAERIADVVQYAGISTLGGGRQLHGDIVVKIVAGHHVETIGGNLADTNTPAAASGGVRKRRYPLDAASRIVVSETQNFAQERATGILPPIPPPNAAGGVLSERSTGRIFALLSPVEDCAMVESPGTGWLMPIVDLVLR